MHFSTPVLCLAWWLGLTRAVPFDVASTALTDAEALGNRLFHFGDQSEELKPRASNSRCKTFPGDFDWPTQSEWNAFKTALGGALIETVPLAAPCHSGPHYDAAQCAVIQANFQNSSFHMNDPASIMGPWAEGNTCPPTSDPSTPCTLGGYPVYVVNATSARQVQLAVNFARNANIRLVIKNTGHDFIGKSAGAGALSVWTHQFDAFEYLPSYHTVGYTGPAARVGAGMQSFELYEHAAAVNATFVAPGGTTVGAFGGYMQGGGHSVIASLHGLAADQVLSLEVVTADGKLVTASATSHADLFWAIRGGGGSCFGIVISAIVKAHPVTSIASSIIFFDTATPPTNVSTEVFWKGIDKYFAFLPKFCDDFGFSLIFLTSSAQPTLDSEPLTKRADPTFSAFFSMIYPKKTAAEADALLAPFLESLRSVGINVAVQWQYYPSFPEFFRTSPVGDFVGNNRYVSRLFPRQNFENNALRARTLGAVRDAVTQGYWLLGDGLTPTLKVAGNPDNAVNPAWRKAIMHATAVDSLPEGYTPEILQAKHAKMERVLQSWRDVSPGAGAYLNEADLEEPNWQQSFYGTNYPRLYAIKKRYDPKGVFYAPTAVGSEEWKVITADGTPTQNGKLCRA